MAKKEYVLLDASEVYTSQPSLTGNPNNVPTTSMQPDVGHQAPLWVPPMPQPVVGPQAGFWGPALSQPIVEQQSLFWGSQWQDCWPNLYYKPSLTAYAAPGPFTGYAYQGPVSIYDNQASLPRFEYQGPVPSNEYQAPQPASQRERALHLAERRRRRAPRSSRASKKQSALNSQMVTVESAQELDAVSNFCIPPRPSIS